MKVNEQQMKSNWIVFENEAMNVTLCDRLNLHFFFFWVTHIGDNYIRGVVARQ